MKKSIIIPVLTLLACACSKTADTAAPVIDTSGHTCFEVSIESLVFDGSSHDLTWAKGTSIGVFGSEQGNNEEYLLRSSDEDKSEAIFYGPLVKGDVFAYSPYREGMLMDGSGLPYHVPQTQSFADGASLAEHFISTCPRLFAAIDADSLLTFRSPAGIIDISFGFNEPIEILSISLSSSRAVSGRFNVDRNCIAYGTEESLNEIILDLSGQAVSSRTDAGLTHFHIIIPSGYYGNGELVLHVDDGKEGMTVILPEIEISRSEDGCISLSEIKVGASLPGFDKEDGYIE